MLNQRLSRVMSAMIIVLMAQIACSSLQINNENTSNTDEPITSATEINTFQEDISQPTLLPSVDLPTIPKDILDDRRDEAFENTSNFSPTEVVLLSKFETRTEDISVHGNYVYLVGEKVTVLDISILESPKMLIQWEPLGAEKHLYTKVQVVDNFVYVSAFSFTDGIAIIDTAKATSHSVLSIVKSEIYQSTGFDFAVNGKYLFVLLDNNLLIYDVSDPSTPTEVATHGFGGQFIHLDASVAYIGGGGNLFMYDFSDINNPILLGTANVSGTINSIYVKNKIAFVSGSFGERTKFLDISNPSNIKLLGYSVFPAFARTTEDAVVNSSESLLYLAKSSAGLRVVDISGFRSTRLELTTDEREIFTYEDVTASRLILSGKIIFIGAYDGFYILEQFGN